MKKILIAGRDPFLLRVYANRLRNSGYDIIIASEGETVINRAKNINPDLLILDSSMPGAVASNSNFRNGSSILSALREDESLKDLKVVMLSSFEHEEEIRNISYFDAPLKHLSKAENTAEEIAQEIKRILS